MSEEQEQPEMLNEKRIAEEKKKKEGENKKGYKGCMYIGLGAIWLLITFVIYGAIGKMRNRVEKIGFEKIKEQTDGTPDSIRWEQQGILDKMPDEQKREFFEKK